MANSQAICTSFKVELLNGHHAFGTSVTRGDTTADTYKGALYLSSGSLGAATTVYSATSEVSGTNYTAGGAAIQNNTAPSSSGTTAFWTPSAALTWTTVTLSTAFNALLIYNSRQSNKAVGVFTFSDQTVTAGNFTLNMPTNDSSTGLIRLA